MFMKQNAAIRRDARLRIGPRVFGEPWISLVLVFVVEAILCGGVQAPLGGTEEGSFLLTVLVSGVLAFGVATLMLRFVRTGEVHLADLFAAFGKNFVNIFLLGLVKALYILLWALLFIIPGIVRAYAYAFAEHIAADNPEWEWKLCLKRSKQLTDGYKAQLFALDLGFIGWYIVGLLCLGVGILWVIPYHMSARTCFYEALLQKEALVEEAREVLRKAAAEKAAKKEAANEEKDDTDCPQPSAESSTPVGTGVPCSQPSTEAATPVGTEPAGEKAYSRRLRSARMR